MGGHGERGGVSLDWGVATDVGRVRAVNEDSALALAPVFVVADGMGGHAAGDVASTMLVDRFHALAHDGVPDVDGVVALIQQANADIFAAGGHASGTGAMGTTGVGVVLVENGPSSSWLVFNVGDSRAYRFFDGRLEQLSIDHSYVQELVDSGEVSQVEARTHPHRNVVTRALGVENTVATDVWLRTPTVGERFVLCSDGLSSEVDDEHIATIVGASLAPAEVAEHLVAAALEAGGRDNVTVVVLDVLSVEPLVAEPTTAPRSEIVALQRRLDHSEAVEPETAVTEDAPEALPVPLDMIEEMPSWLPGAIEDDAGDHPDRIGAAPIEISDVPSVTKDTTT